MVRVATTNFSSSKLIENVTRKGETVQSMMDREAGSALRTVLGRDPTPSEVRNLRLGQAALGDKDLLLLRTANGLETLKEQRRIRGELLQQMRKKRRRLRKLRSQNKSTPKRAKKN